MGAVTRSQVAGWDANALAAVATMVAPRVQQIDDSADKMRSSIDGLHWSGTARGAADDRADRENQQMRKVGSAFDDLAAACMAGARAMEPMIAGLTRTASNLESDNFDVAEDWTVTDKHNYSAAIAACGDNAQAQNQVRQLQKQRGDEAATSTVSLKRLAVALGTADQNCAAAINAANVEISSLTPATAALNGTIAGKDLADLKSGTATADELARLHAAAQLTDEQKTDLVGGKPVNLTQGQFDYLRQVMRAQDGMSVQDIDKMTSALPQGNQADLANAMQLVSSPNVHTASVLTAGAVPTVADHGGMSQLPTPVRTLLTDNPVSMHTNWTAAGPFTTADVSRAGDFKALTNIMGRGDQSLAQGSDVDRGLLKQGAEIAGATGRPNVTMTMEGRGVHDSEVGSLADRLLGAGGHDAQAVHDFVTGSNMASTVDHGGSYNASDHVLEVLQHKWDPGQHGAANMFASIGESAGQPLDSFANKQGGESASALAQIMASHSATLSQNMPNQGTTRSGRSIPN
ncbi:hypothetical protein [Speluncibacter jeojiensis]|uniref:TPR repeat domain-containing protein n=1 Tax=Speluncibacter jeojiensis TaxID=2710754 RepID=A0A9X4LZ61_9ACTN|nr:hypothetical protein [Corynebacteriales bacterium D3-21]